TAELAIALLLTLARNVARGDRQVRKGSWAKKGLTGSELTGKQLGVVGFGRIGRVVADRALGLKMSVVAYDPYLTGSSAENPPGEDVVVTPHPAAASHEAQRNVALDIAQQVCDFLIHGVAHNAVNAPAVNAQTLREIAPYVLLSEKLGSFLAQISNGPIQKIELSVSGEIATKDHRHVPLALLVGVLRHVMDVGVNFVNAPL